MEEEEVHHRRRALIIQRELQGEEEWEGAGEEKTRMSRRIKLRKRIKEAEKDKLSLDLFTSTAESVKVV